MNNIQSTNILANHLECPKCGKHNIVQYRETRYVCLSCNWEKDIAAPPPPPSNPPLFPLPFWLGAGLFLVLVL